MLPTRNCASQRLVVWQSDLITGAGQGIGRGVACWHVPGMGNGGAHGA